MIGWVIFRAETIQQAWEYLVRMITTFDFSLPAHGKDPLIYIGILLVIEWIQREKQFGLQIEKKGIFQYRSIRWGIYYIVFITTFYWLENKPNSFTSSFNYIKNKIER